MYVKLLIVSPVFETLTLSKAADMITESLDQVIFGVGVPVAMHTNVMSSFKDTSISGAEYSTMRGFSIKREVS